MLLKSRRRLAVMIIIFFLFTFLAMPSIIVVAVSFTSASYAQFPPRGFSLKWFWAVFEEDTFMLGIYNSLRLAFLTIIVSNMFAIPAAMALARRNYRYGATIMSFFMSPLSLPMIVLGIGLLLFSSKLNMGLSFSFLLAGHVVITIPYAFSAVFGTYRGLEPNLEESAKVLGATNFQIFRYVILPLIKPGIIVGSIFTFIISFDNIPLSIFLTGSRSVTLPVAVLVYLQENFDPSIAALSTLQLIFVIGTLYLLQKLYSLEKLSKIGQ